MLEISCRSAYSYFGRSHDETLFEENTACDHLARLWPLRERGGGLLRGPACARTLRTHPQPAPSPDAAVGAGLGFAAVYRSPPPGATHTVLSRRASVRGGRCGAANGPFDLLDTAGTARTDASFDRLTSCGNPRLGALEHACGQSRGDDLLLPSQPAGVLLEHNQLQTRMLQRRALGCHV